MAERICQKCGKKFGGYINARYCDACHPIKNRPKRHFIKPGDIYGFIKVIKRSDRPYCAWECQCLKCGQDFVWAATSIKKLKDTGCPECLAKVRDAEKVKELQSEIDKLYGDLKVKGISYDDREGDGKRPYATCECQLCGGISEIRLSRLHNGGASKCAECARKVLAPGRKIRQGLCVDGTFISAIDGGRAVNKNSSTGYTGVYWQKKNRKYRAHITFRRKQYHIGLYDKLEDAVAARKEAEKKIYGDFLAWYAETHPKHLS